MTPELQKKVDFAIKLLQAAEKMAEKKGQPVEICYSGGKDSDVILELAKMAGIKYSKQFALNKQAQKVKYVATDIVAEEPETPSGGGNGGGGGNPGELEE